MSIDSDEGRRVEARLAAAVQGYEQRYRLDPPPAYAAFVDCPAEFQLLTVTGARTTVNGHYLYPALVEWIEPSTGSYRSGAHGAGNGDAWLWDESGTLNISGGPYLGRPVWVNPADKVRVYQYIPTAVSSSGGGALTINLRVYYANTTWTKPSGLVCAEIWVQGDGGGGGGAWSGASWPGASGGGAGGFAYAKLNAASLSATEAVTVGTGGAGGVGGGGSPTDGGTGTGSTFGSHMTCNGGGGGPSNGTNSGFSINAGAVPAAYVVSYVYNRSASTPGGTSSGGDLNIAGGDGGVGTALIGGSATNGICSGGAGGASPFGAGGAMGITLNAAAGYGSGGAGASFLKQTGTADYSGGAGTGGVVIVKEYVQ